MDKTVGMEDAKKAAKKQFKMVCTCTVYHIDSPFTKN